MSGRTRLHVTPLKQADAKAFVAAHHRHNPPPLGMVFCLGVSDDDGVLRGVATVGRPVARHLDDGQTLEVTRTCTDGTHNAVSMLLSASWRAAKALGWTRLITYTREDEPGTSTRAAGWREIARRPARRGWDTPSRPRSTDSYDGVPRVLWEAS